MKFLNNWEVTNYSSIPKSQRHKNSRIDNWASSILLVFSYDTRTSLPSKNFHTRHTLTWHFCPCVQCWNAYSVIHLRYILDCIFCSFFDKSNFFTKYFTEVTFFSMSITPTHKFTRVGYTHNQKKDVFVTVPVFRRFWMIAASNTLDPGQNVTYLFFEIICCLETSST